MTYWFRAGALNWNYQPNFVMVGSTLTTVAGVAAPTGLGGTASTPASINWTWNLVTGATGYHLYLATSTATLIAMTPALSYLETGLSANTTYSLVVTAVQGGLESPFSSSATRYTQAIIPAAPSITNIGSSSFTVTWGTAGNPGYTPYQVELAPNNAFLVGVSTPIHFTDNFTSSSTSLIGLAPNTSYWVRVTARNGNGISTSPGPSAGVTTRPNGMTTGSGSGLGTAILAPLSVPEGGVVTTTVTFNVPAGGMNAGGRLEIDLPPGWWPGMLQNYNALQDGYVTATSTAAVGFNLLFANASPGVTVSFSSNSLAPGTLIQVAFNNIHPSCPALNSAPAPWSIKSAMSPSDPLGDIMSPSTQTLVAGQAQGIGYNPWNPLTVVSGQISPPVMLQATDNCGQPVATTAPLTVRLQGLFMDGITTDTGAGFSTAANFSVPVTSVTILTASSTTTYYYRTTSSSSSLQIRGDYGTGQQVWRQVNVLKNVFSFSNVSLDNGVSVTGQKNILLSPDGSGVNNFAYIRFSPSDNSTNWHVAISSTNFQTLVFERWGAGNPQGMVSWDGRNMFQSMSVVQNSTYTVKIEVVGVTSDTSLSIVVNSAQISGTVFVGISPLAGAQISAQRTNGPGYSTTVTDINGNYVLSGLHAGTPYNLYTVYTNPANQAVSTAQSSAPVTAPSASQNFVLTTPAVIRVSAVAPIPAAATVFGNLNIHSSDYSQNYSGNLRLLAGVNTSDNGDSFNPSTWTVFYVPSNTDILHLNMQGYGAADVTVTGSSDVVISLSPQANVYGWIVLPSTVSYPTWASVSGTPANTQTPTVWGGASFNVGQSSAVYSIFAVTTGTYNLLGQVSGYMAGVLNNVIMPAHDLGNSMTGGEDFPAFSVGGTISGSLTIVGDTSGQSNPLNLWVGANSSQSGYNVSTQVQLSTDARRTSSNYQIGGLPSGTYQMFAPYLQGFDSSTNGPQNVVVSAGSGHLDFVLTQETGQISVTVMLPTGKDDYADVHISLQGPRSADMDLSGSTTTIQYLGTGFYNLTATYRTSGAQSQQTINLTNGQAVAVVLDLSAPTYSVSGTVSVQSGFSMKSTTGTLITVNTIGDLLANAATQNISIGGVGSINSGGVDCSQVTPISTSTARVEAFSKSFNSFGNTNRSGFTNCFPVSGYNFGAIQADGSYTIPNLSPGVWEIDVYPYFDGSQVPSAAALQQFVTITNSSATDVNFSLSAGNAVSGTVSLPTGVTDIRPFDVQILDNRGNSIQTARLQVGSAGAPAPSVNYTFTNLPAGQYSLLIQDSGTFDSTLNQNVIKYVASPVPFTINGGDLGNVNVTMGRAARIIGTIGIQAASSGGSAALTVITSSNTSLLPNNFQIFAQADPWIPGGFRSSESSQDGTGKPGIDPDNHFTIDGLAPGTYDVSLQQNSNGMSAQATGGLDLASYTQGSVVVTEGQTVDLGVIILKPGISVSGTVTDASGHSISNIIVRATPSASQHGQNSIQATSDAQGNITLTGLSPDSRMYDIVAAPRPYPGDSTPPVPYGQVIRLAVDVTQVPTPALNFTLTPATAQFTGKVVTVDGGTLSFPDGDQVGYPAAAVYLHLEGSTSDDNPLGMENATALDGSFAAGDLVAGLYDVTIESLGYQPYRLTGVALSKGASQSLGTITLPKGAELDTTLTKPDGTLVNTGQVQTAVGVSPDLTSIIFGQVAKDASTGNILAIKFSGFQLSPQIYNILLFDDQNNITTPPEGRGLVFTSSAAVMSRALTYEPSAPFAYTDAKRSGAIGSAVNLTYYFSRPIRNRGDDQDPSHWFTVSSGQGNLANFQISGDRRQLVVTYSPAVGEQNAIIVFSAHTVDLDPSTGIEFVLSKTVTLLLGQKATTESNINPALGGSISLATNNDPSNVYIRGNSLLNSDGSAADATTSYSVTLTATDDVGSFASGAGAARSAAYNALLSYGPRAYVSEAYQAMSVARADAGVNPLSSFYSILLPAGLSHSLNQTAFLTLNYDSTADPTQINVYYFDGAEYLLQNSGRAVDPVNHTITVGVSHFSTFVVLENNLPVIIVGGGSGSGPDIDVFNFPNPFDLQTKIQTLGVHGGNAPMNTDGTIIRYFVPASKVGIATIRIYDVVGEKVRTIGLPNPVADSYGYVSWDGRNDAGNKVASGVYIGVLDVGGAKKFWKMAVIK